MSDPVAVVLPSMGESVTEGTVSRWLKAVGDEVKMGEAVVEVTTDKVDVEVPSPSAGTLTEIVAAEGATVAVGATLARISEGATAGNGAEPTTARPKPEAAATETAPPQAAAEPGGGTDPNTSETPTPGRRNGNGKPAAAPPQAAEGHGVPSHRVSPLARRAAAFEGLDPTRVSGSGPGGQVRRSDVVGASPAPAAPNGSANGRATPAPAPLEGEVTPLRGPAAVLAGFMEASREIPTATSFRTISVGVLDGRRRELNDALRAAGREEKVSFTHLIGYALAQAALDVPALSAHFARTVEGDPIRVQPGVHLGIAVDSRRKDGSRFLVVPVIRDAAGRDFRGFRDEYERLIAKARTNALSPDEMKGASMTLTNPGGIGTVASVPRLMPGQGSIIALGAITYPAGFEHVAAATLKQLGVSKVMTMTSTYDHRVIQGAESGELLGRVEALLGGEDGFWGQVFDALSLPVPVGSPQPVPVGGPQPAPVGAPALRTDGTPPAADGGLPSHELLAAVSAGMSLVKAHRTHGHLGAHLDPLGSEPVGDPAMDPATVHLTADLMERIPADVLRTYVPGANLAEILPNLRKTYCGTIAFEIEHISSHEQRVWLREHIESGAFRVHLSPERKLQLLRRLSKVDAMERYLRKAFLGKKTFSIEGVDAMVPMIEELLDHVAEDGVGELVVGMSHRGRLATIAHVANRPYENILQAFEQGEQRRALGGGASDPTGDVKYHLGTTGTYLTESKRPITVRVLPNPSHLEAVNPVVEGWTRAEQTRRGASTLHLDPTAALPLLIHGDAAFAGQGVVSETLNLQSLPGYTTGGTIHIIANNQIGFTTEPSDGRSTRYASDPAKGYDAPIIHCNADDIEACIQAMRLAYDYRRTYHRDVVIDLIGYRRFGHNEADEPNYTQPEMYQRIKNHPTVRELFASQLVAEGLLTADEAEQLSEKYIERVREAHQRVKQSLASVNTEIDPVSGGVGGHTVDEPVRTTVNAETLTTLNEQLIRVPDGFTMNAKLRKQLDRRPAALTSGSIDWGTAEALAFGSLLLQGRPIRMTGQDTERGTFSHRHLVFHDAENGAQWTPMLHVVGASATFELHNSPLSEYSALGFEYGYSAATPDTLVIWEAQFGDFVNNAQGVVDQFISSGNAKWGQTSRLTLLLPHGYEGMGPEHSSSRLERFLQLSAHGNMRVVYPSTAAQYFHLLRMQALSERARPLIALTPKSLLRQPAAAATLEDLSEGHFQRVIDDPATQEGRERVHTLLLCTGKIYWDLALHPLRQEVNDLAIARIEQLDPLPIEDVLELIHRYPRLEQVLWVQEEPSNMGAWPHLARPIGKRRPYEIRWDYIGRPRRASPSEGFNGAHLLEQERVVTTALTMSREGQERALRPADGATSSAPTPAQAFAQRGSAQG
ncbi:MAG: multifunctional oxoglutarate decarboxylase/oxoglutarate dehydrogenase thiamine pyrophosphate-binding subunit/dihydrolipoyllysine-residue succinyltransferase subunit [Candidatus Dormibacteria bacterium]